MTCVKQCCCNCKSQLKVYKHPWNENDYAKGRVSELMGYACDSSGMMPYNTVTFSDREHSLCESHEAK